MTYWCSDHQQWERDSPHTPDSVANELRAENERRICHHALYHEVCSMGGNDPCPHQVENERLRVAMQLAMTLISEEDTPGLAYKELAKALK